MASRIDHDRVQMLLSRSHGSDASLAKALGVNQSTISRLRNGRIAKVSKYIPRLEHHLGLQPGATAPTDAWTLAELAKRSPALAEVIAALGRFMQERA